MLVLAGQVFASAVTLVWQVPAGGRCVDCIYRVYRTEQCGHYDAPRATGLTLETFKDTTVVSQKTYCYTVTMYDRVRKIESSKSIETQVSIP